MNECRLLKIISSTWNTAWLLDEWAFALVCPDVRRLLPWVISLRTSSTQSTSDSVSPTTTTCCFPSSNTRNLDLPDRRSNTYNYEIFFVELMNMILVSCQFIVKLGSRSKGSRLGQCPNFKVSKYLNFKIFLKVWPGPGAWSYNCNATTTTTRKLFV